MAIYFDPEKVVFYWPLLLNDLPLGDYLKYQEFNSPSSFFSTKMNLPSICFDFVSLPSHFGGLKPMWSTSYQVISSLVQKSSKKCGS